MKTCCWLGTDPAQTPFPEDNASATFERAEEHRQFISDVSNNKLNDETGLFTKDNKWDKWARTFKECTSLPLGCIGIPLSHIVCEDKQPQPLPDATNKANFILMARLSGRTFKSDSKNCTFAHFPFWPSRVKCHLLSKGPAPMQGVANQTGQPWSAIIKAPACILPRQSRPRTPFETHIATMRINPACGGQNSNNCLMMPALL